MFLTQSYTNIQIITIYRDFVKKDKYILFCLVILSKKGSVALSY